MPTKIFYLTVEFKAPGVRNQDWEFDSKAKRDSAIKAIKSANKDGIKKMHTKEGWKND
jgi:hypothetical protein